MDSQVDIATLAESATGAGGSGPIGPSDARPASAGAGATANPSLGRARSLATQAAHVALHAEDKVRAGDISLVLSALAAIGLANEIIVYRSGSEALRLVSIVLLALIVAGGIVVRALRRSTDRVRIGATLVFGAMLVSASFFESLHLGVFSAFQAIVILALSVFALDGRPRLVLPLAVAACALYFVPAMLIALGVIADPGVFDSTHVRVSERVSAAVGTMAVYVAALWQARRSRRSMQAMVERSNEAVLVARQRDALLAEANQNLDAILGADAGRGGRYTGANVGSFQLGGIVGRGGMGEVYEAQRVSDGRRAAVKLLTARALGDAALVRRFLREAEISGKLHAPNVVELLESGEVADGAPYLAMELLVGHDLAWHLRQRIRLPLSQVVAMVEQVALGLKAAHAAGIVHRDLKPPNLFLHEGPAPVWKILDFGIGRLRESNGTLTEGAILGTPGYMAPEQVHSGAAEPRADVFGLAAVAYRALTGQPPFGVQDVQAVFDVVYRQPLAPSTVLRGVPRDVDRVLAIALAKKPADRFGGATDFAAALGAASREELSPELRARADGILRARPWGSVMQPG
jgi:eukaryotic-like serine/threonine-protein kinase